MILAGDEFRCMVFAKNLIQNENRLTAKRIVYSRSSKDQLDKNVINICCGYLHKEADQIFEYIKIGQEQHLENYVKSKYIDLIPISEFKDLKNQTYTIVAYDLLSFYSDIYPRLKYANYANKESAHIPNVFEFSELFLARNFQKLLTHYAFVLEQNEENYLWVVNDSLDTCLKILAKDTAGINSYKLKKLTYIAQKLGFQCVYHLKDICVQLIAASRNQLDYVQKLKILEAISC